MTATVTQLRRRRRSRLRPRPGNITVPITAHIGVTCQCGRRLPIVSRTGSHQELLVVEHCQETKP